MYFVFLRNQKKVLEAKKEMKNIYVVAVAMIMLGTAIGAGVVWQYRQGEVDGAFQSGVAYQQGLGTTFTTPASITLEGPSTFDQEDEVATDGGVDTEAADSGTLYINNTEESGGRTASNVYLTLWNPVTDNDGLHENLETDYTDIYVTVQGVTSRLYTDGEYIGKDTLTPGIKIGDLSPKDAVEFTVYVNLEDSVAGTFQDGETATCYFYLYQPSANYCDVLSYTITT